MMINLTIDEIRLIADKLGREVLVEATDRFPYEIVSVRSRGYSDDPEIGKLQAKLSIMLTAARDGFPADAFEEIPEKD